MRSISLNRFNSILLSLILLFLILYYGRIILVPVTFGIFFAMLCLPVARKLERMGASRILSTIASLLLVVFVAVLIFKMVLMQFRELAHEMPKIKERTTELIGIAEKQLVDKFDISQEQMESIREKLKHELQSAAGIVKDIFTSLPGLLRELLLIVVSMFLLLYKREKYEQFFLMLVKEENREETKTVLTSISRIAQQYLGGRLLSVMIFTVLFTAGFLIVGVKGAFLLAFLSALMTIVPFVGSVMGGIFPFAVAMVTTDSSGTAFGALAVIVIVQLFDNYFIEPYVIGGAVHISGLFTLFFLFIGGIMWGAAGMIIFIPMLGVAKIIFDHVQELKPLGYLLGDQRKGSQTSRLMEKIKGVFGK